MMPEPITVAILSYGPSGIIISVLLAALRWLFLRYDAVQEARIAQVEEITKVAAASAAALEVANRNAILVLNELQARGRLEPVMGIISARPQT